MTTEHSVALVHATDEHTQNTFRKLAFQEYLKRGWLNMDAYPDSMVIDAYDDASAVLVIQSGGEIVSGLRIVHDSEHGFPHEDILALDKFQRGQSYPHDAMNMVARTSRTHMAELTRVVGKRRQRMLIFDIAKCVYWYAEKNNIALYLMVVDMEFFILSNTLGMPLEPIGVPLVCEGSWSIPAITVPSRYPTEVPKKSPRGWEFISSPDNLLGPWVRPQ